MAHPALASGLDLETYRSELHSPVSLQYCMPMASGGDSRGSERLTSGRPAVYVHIFPNTCINVYGPWTDTNLVLPTGPATCKVIFDWHLEPGEGAGLEFMESSLRACDVVQQEDIAL